MRLLALDVEHFGPIRSAKLALGPGLNVLYGPNDLGKSHLVAAIRVALLHPHDRKEALGYAPWNSDHTPEVQLEFELSPELRYRVRKSLAKGSRGSSELFCSRVGGDYKLEDKGRGVDGKLCELLRWGLEPPGGGSGRKPAPDTYLTRVFLGRQAEVMEVFERSLANDPQESGKDRLTSALQALGQDPLFREVLQATTTEVDKAFNASGSRRSAKGAVWAKLADQIADAREALQNLRTQVNESEDERRKLQELIERQTLCQVAHDQAQEHLNRLELRLAAQRRLELVRQERERIQAELEALTAGRRQVNAQREEVSRREAAQREAQEQLQQAEGERTARSEALQRQEAEREQGLGRRRDELELVLLQDQRALEQAEARHKAAEEVGRLEAELARSETELERKQGDVDRHTAAVQAATLVQALGAALTKEREARARHERLARARLQHRQLETALQEATDKHTQAQRAWEKSDEDCRNSEAALQRVQSQEGGQARLLREQELGRLRAEADGALREATARVAEARQALEAAAHVEQLERALAERQGGLGTARKELKELEGQLTAGAAEVELTKGLEALLVWRAAAEAEQQALQRVQRVHELRRDALALRDRAATIETSQQALSLPTREALTALRQLDRDLQVAEAKLGVGVTVTLQALQALTPQAALDGAVSAGAPLAAGQQARWEADSRIEVTLGELARLTVEGGRPADRVHAAALRARWDREGLAALRAAGATDLDTLEAACEQAEQRRREAAELRREADGLETQAREQGDLEAQLATAQSLTADRRRRLAGLNLPELEAAAQGLSAATLETRALEAQSSLDALNRALAEKRPALAALEARIEGQEQELIEARSKAAGLASALGSAPSSALSQAQAVEGSAHEAVDKLDGQLAALASESSVQLSQAREALAKTTRAREAAHAARDAAQQQQEQARTALAKLEGELAGLEAAAAEVDPAVPAAEVAQLRAQVAALSAAHPGVRGGDPDRAPSQLEAERVAAEKALRALELESSGQRGDLERGRQTLQERRASLGGEWRGVSSEAQAVAIARREAITKRKQELSALQQTLETALQAARDALAAATQQRDRAKLACDSAVQARQEAEKKLSELQGALAIREGQAAALDLPGALAAEQAASQALSALPPPPPGTVEGPAAVEEAREAAALADKQLKSLAKEIDMAQGALGKVGGGVVEEKAKDAEEALQRAEERERQVALDYDAWKLLKETLEEVERSQTTNLGQTLSKPVAERFRTLAGPAYGPLALGPNLEADGVEVQGARQGIEVLSVGTREQLATLLRVTVAGQLRSAIVLDDQLTQSDPARMRWFKDALRRAGAASQVVVVTCRPFDYLEADELPGDAGTFAEVRGTRAIDLARALKSSQGARTVPG